MTDYLNTARDIVASAGGLANIEAVDLALALGADYTEIDNDVLRIELKDPGTHMVFTLARGRGEDDPAGSFDAFFSCYELDGDDIARPFIEGDGVFVKDVDDLAAALSLVAYWL